MNRLCDERFLLIVLTVFRSLVCITIDSVLYYSNVRETLSVACAVMY